ncbi:hypothetical protein CRUP_024996 [Coryphaenoides rupestris]|nr:hypothetical protein CRUP_024996 [Coryphaenoides rupestris]
MAQVAEGMMDPNTLSLELAYLWTQKDLSEMRAVASRGFSRLAEPLGALLTVLDGCKKPAELKLEVLLAFHKWLQNHPQVTLDALPEEQALALRRRALDHVTERTAGIVNKIAGIYQLEHLDGATLRQHAATFSIKMEVQQLLDMEDMCTPLLLQDKVTLAEHYVSGHPDLERRLATLLDSWCDPRFSPDTVVRRYPDVVQNQFHIDQLKPKILSKHVFRLVGKFNIDPNLCRHSAIIADDPEMHKYLDAILTDYCRSNCAAKFSQQFRDAPDERKSPLQDAPQGADWDRSDRFYQLPIPRSQVHFLGAVEDLQRAREVLCKEGGTVGLDMEWCAGFGCVVPERVSLIQLAVADRVFILDMCAADLWQHPCTLEVVRSLLGNPKVLKLGKEAREGKLGHGMKRLTAKRSSEKGLSQLVQRVLGRPLDKKEQLSYWQRRPLHPNQLRYAASDAFCLLEVHAVLSREPARYGLTAQQLDVVAF